MLHTIYGAAERSNDMRQPKNLIRHQKMNLFIEIHFFFLKAFTRLTSGHLRVV
jgi:hypothetical protein